MSFWPIAPHLEYTDEEFAEIMMDRFQPIKVLGSGSFGTVVKCIDNNTGELVAVKQQLDEGETIRDDRNMLENEAACLAHLRTHPNVVQFIIGPWFLPSGTIRQAFALELCSGTVTDLFQQHQSGRLVKILFTDVLRGLDHLDRYGVVHRDLKSDNILYTSTNRGKVFKLSDFGLAADEGQQDSRSGTICYMSPEAFNYRTFTHKSDIWALGITMLTILNLGNCRRELFRRAPARNGTFYEHVIDWADHRILGNMQTIFNFHRQERPRARHLLTQISKGRGLMIRNEDMIVGTRW